MTEKGHSILIDIISRTICAERGTVCDEHPCDYFGGDKAKCCHYPNVYLPEAVAVFNVIEPWLREHYARIAEDAIVFPADGCDTTDAETQLGADVGNIIRAAKIEAEKSPGFFKGDKIPSTYGRQDTIA